MFNMCRYCRCYMVGCCRDIMGMFMCILLFRFFCLILLVIFGGWFGNSSYVLLLC